MDEVDHDHFELMSRRHSFFSGDRKAMEIFIRFNCCSTRMRTSAMMKQAALRASGISSVARSAKQCGKSTSK